MRHPMSDSDRDLLALVLDLGEAGFTLARSVTPGRYAVRGHAIGATVRTVGTLDEIRGWLADQQERE
jgi:hypothetical protein